MLVGLSRQRHRRNALLSSPAVPAPVTRAFSYAETGGGWAGLTDSDNATYPGTIQVFTHATNSLGFAAWVGTIKGSAARARLGRRAVGPPHDGDWFASIDGADYVSLEIDEAINSTHAFFSVFSGLDDTEHLVVLRNRLNGFGMQQLGIEDAWEVTGAAPSIEIVDEWRQVGDGTSDFISPNALEDSYQSYYMDVNRTPKFKPRSNDMGEDGTGYFRTDASEIIVVSNTRHAFLYDGDTLRVVEGAAIPSGNGGVKMRAHRFTGLSGAKDYLAWGATVLSVIGAHFIVGVRGGAFLTPTAPAGFMDWYGDSITEGTPDDTLGGPAGDYSGYSHAWRVGFDLGYVPGNFSQAGERMSQLGTRLAAQLPELSRGSSDVAIVAQGQNSPSQTAAEIHDVADKLLAAGYGTVIFQGVLPVAGNGHLTTSANLSAAVTSYADARVKHLDVNGWTDPAIAKVDGVHPTPAGHDALVDYLLAALPPLLT